MELGWANVNFLGVGVGAEQEADEQEQWRGHDEH
eukprot:CAMPEP_0177414000 /NCGR_PEP_ID=MMETSP0368-20130122/66828_1 /TAXON_ID=447022 ORGANISM="Scrippsiella hangoei-like, Strain SHHI-4" /NCGR_SAMPLE_ID=MMETSP0368 /ASSEMBLY_ACC=CAM_ASM_000363 /LENGTH=33 /DNA_ID= /DNA_START= /DNA_END= /DNA_ORIENTATION=